MPMFEYRCSECNSKFEFLHKSSSVKEKVICPSCNSEKIIKLFSKFSSISSSSGNTTFDGCASGSCGLTVDSCPTGQCGLN